MAPQVRRKPYADTLANACANFGYALLTGETLFSLVRFALEQGALEDADPETLSSIRETILSSDGLVLVEESEEEAGAAVEEAEAAAALPGAESAAEPDSAPAPEEPAGETSEPVTADAESGD